MWRVVCGSLVGIVLVGRAWADPISVTSEDDFRWQVLAMKSQVYQMKAQAFQRELREMEGDLKREQSALNQRFLDTYQTPLERLERTPEGVWRTLPEKK